jgi:hypothetical protein
MNTNAEVTLLYILSIVGIVAFRTLAPQLWPAERTGDYAFAALAYAACILQAIHERKTESNGNLLCWLTSNVIAAIAATHTAIFFAMVWNAHTMEITLAGVGAFILTVVFLECEHVECDDDDDGSDEEESEEESRSPSDEEEPDDSTDDEEQHEIASTDRPNHHIYFEDSSEDDDDDEEAFVAICE